MTRGPHSLVMRHLRHVVGRQVGPGPSDADLLARFVAHRDEAAFELLVWRHERMVRGVCRRVLRSEQDVEDACQATFLTLACKSGSLGKLRALAGWLYTVAYRIALRVAADGVRRGRHEQEAGEQRAGQTTVEPVVEASHREIRAVVDEEVSRLPENYRLAVILCYLEGKTNEEAAAQLGCPTGTVVTWLARARQRLRGRLARRGVVVTTGALAALLSALDPASAAAPAWLGATVKAALAFAHDRTAAGLVSTRVALLTRGALHAMLLNKLKTVAAVLLALSLVGSGSVAAYWSLQQNERPEASAVAQPLLQEKNDRRKEEDKSTNKEDKKEKLAKVEEVLNRSFKTGKAPSLVIEVFNGTIEVVADAKQEVVARVVKQSERPTEKQAQEGLKNIDVQMTQDKDVIRIVARRLQENDGQGGERTSAVVHVPPEALQDLHTSNGAVRLTGGTGKITIRTSNGPIQVKDAKGALHLTTANGPIEVAGVTGLVELETKNGRIDVQADRAIVTAHTSNGEVVFRGSLADGTHSFTTSNGPIVLTLPADTPLKVDATTTNGKITCDFTGGADPLHGKAHYEASVGDAPSVTLKLLTHNGSIEIHKKK